MSERARTIEKLEALCAAAQEQAKTVHPEYGPCSLTCAHNAAYVNAIAAAGPALLAVARAAAQVHVVAGDVTGQRQLAHALSALIALELT